MTFAIRRLTAPPLPQSDGTHFHFPFQKYTKKIYGRSSPILEPFFLRGGREVAGKKNLSDFVAVFDDLGGDGDDRENHGEDDLADGEVDDEDE